MKTGALEHLHRWVEQWAPWLPAGARRRGLYACECGERREVSGRWIDADILHGARSSSKKGNIAARIARHKNWEKQRGSET